MTNSSYLSAATTHLQLSDPLKLHVDQLVFTMLSGVFLIVALLHFTRGDTDVAPRKPQLSSFIAEVSRCMYRSID